MKKFLISSVLLIFGTTLFAQKPDSLDRMIGQMILIGIGDFNQMDDTESIFRSIESGKVGGIIFFEKNISKTQPKENLKWIIRKAQEKSAIPLFVSIDEEGGRVNRLSTKYGFPSTVTAQYLGQKDSLEVTKRYAHQTAEILNSLGFNLNFAPSADLNVNPTNPIIGKIGRSYSEDYSKVAEHATAFVQMHDQMQVATAIKHFPGHGSSLSDTHLGLTDVSNTWQIKELYPFKMMIDSGYVRVMMTAHIVNRTLDPSKLPATLSYPIVTELLRNNLGYAGVVTSDDLQMYAISKEYGVEEAIRLTINAGIDLVMFCNNVPVEETISAERIHAIIKEHVEMGRIDRQRIIESYDRIINLKKSLGLLDQDY
jgi:beta-N-acetylhexosaminidase